MAEQLVPRAVVFVGREATDTDGAEGVSAVA